MNDADRSGNEPGSVLPAGEVAIAPTAGRLSAEERQEIVDAEHLRLLAIFHYIFGAQSIFIGCFFLIYVVMGFVMIGAAIFVPKSPTGAGPPALLGVFFVLMGVIAIAFCCGVGLLIIYAGYSIHRRARRTYTLILAGLQCTSFPFGTILGVCTFVVLLRPSVEKLYVPNAVLPEYERRFR